ncbi:hypothetical protein CPB86DRAFT_872789 [Serendipita vermifera]|nr:hypothetical protein CPB86DRAFT_872789 [Serendipita vermifera]
MTSVLKRSSNSPPTASEINRINAYVAKCEANIQYIQKELEFHTAELSRSQDAISNLMASIPWAKAALESHQESLGFLNQVLNTLSLPELQRELDIKEETETSKMYKNLTMDVKGNLLRGTAIMEAQISTFQEEAEKLRYHRDKLEDELIGWTFTHDLAQKAIDHFTTIQTQLTSDLNIAKIAISPIRRTPKEVWIRIFQHCIDKGLEEYIVQSNVVPYRPVSLTLSAVCQSWRNVLSTERQMREIITVHPSQYISLNKFHMLSGCLQRTSAPFEFISNLSQTLSWTWRSSYWDDYDNYVDPNRNLRANSISLPIIYPYTVHLVMNDDSSSTTRKAAHLPFRNPKVLDVHIRSAQANSGLLGLFSHFSAVEDLRLDVHGRHILQLGALASALTSLRHLELEIKDMLDVDMIPLLNTNLVELRIRYTGQSGGPGLGSALTLAQLRILGLTYPSSAFLVNLQAQNILELELYDPCRLVPNSGYQQGSLDTIQKLHRISFIDWKTTSSNVSNGNNGSTHANQGVVPIFEGLATDMIAMESISFSGCNLNGQHLVDIFKDRVGTNGGLLKHLQVVKISRCDGITIDQCDELRMVIPELQIYI